MRQRSADPVDVTLLRQQRLRCTSVTLILYASCWFKEAGLTRSRYDVDRQLLLHTADIDRLTFLWSPSMELAAWCVRLVLCTRSFFGRVLVQSRTLLSQADTAPAASATRRRAPFRSQNTDKAAAARDVITPPPSTTPPPLSEHRSWIGTAVRVQGCFVVASCD